jgi:glucan phosphoethanolaminetransferase (alkaline phosphatase superfamily)
MRPPEQAFIDEKVVISTPAVYMRDHEIATKVLPALLARPEPHFVYVNKFGAHFPYRGGYPPDYNGATPTSPRDDLSNRDELLRSYRSAVRWSVDEFFKTFLGQVDLSDTLILYTSDHGQSLLDGDYKLTHCSTGEVAAGEAIVPMFALTAPTPFAERLQAGAKAGFGRTTHFNVYPTLLLAMGYEEEWVTRRFGPSLLNVPRTAPRRFLTGDLFNATGEARWVPVD